MTAHNEPSARDPSLYLEGRPLDVGQFTHAFLDKLERLVVDHSEVLGVVGGNFRIRFFDGEVITVITSGADLGVHYVPIEAPVKFEMQCEEWFLDNLLDPDLPPSYDMNEAALGAGLRVTGDLDVYRRFINLTKKRSFLDVRMGRS